jgi:hypothetical protein
LSFSYLGYSAIDADPAVTTAFFTATAGCFLSGAIALQSSAVRLFLRYLSYFTVHADPTGFTLATPASFLLGAVGVTTLGTAFLFGDLDDLSILTTPNHLSPAMSPRFFF